MLNSELHIGGVVKHPAACKYLFLCHFAFLPHAGSIAAPRVWLHTEAAKGKAIDSADSNFAPCGVLACLANRY